MTVLITGANGFIAEHVIDLLLKENYEVIGVVRSLEKAKKVHQQFGKSSKLSFEIVPELSAPNAFDPIFRKRGKDIISVIHIASPFISGATDLENQLLIPACNGTVSILNSIKQYGNDTVTRVVLTSSLLAITDLHKMGDENVTFTEKDWNPDTWASCQTNSLSAYAGSKKFAEEAAWNFIREHKSSINFDLTVVVPAMALGPHKFAEDVKDGLNVSNGVIDGLLCSSPKRKLAHYMNAPFIDVRDVAKAHLIALKNANAKGQRLCVFERCFGSQDILDIMNQKFPSLRGKISRGPWPGKGDQNRGCNYNTSLSNRILGFEFLSLDQSVEDTVTQILCVRDQIA